MGKTGNVIALVVYLAAVPAGVFLFLTQPTMGYPARTAGIIAGVLAAIGVALIAVVIFQRADPHAPAEHLPAKSGWSLLIGFLVVMAAVVAYFMLKEE
jgi:hypothetical protein